MKASIIIAALALGGSAFAACPDFTGSYVGQCSGEQANGRLERVEFKQAGCSGITSVGDENVTFLLDGQAHAVQGGSYVASWQGREAHVDLTAGVEGVVMSVAVVFGQDAQGKYRITRTTSRSVPALGGESELLESCTYAQE